MKTKNSFKTTQASAFTLVELLVIIALVALVISLTFPALAHAHIKTAEAQCLSNYRRLQLGWELYREDHTDSLMPNAPVGSQTTGWIPSNLIEGWNSVLANTNVAAYATSTMGTYLNQDVTAFRCPADILPSLNGFRLRSTSMNGQFGATVNYNAGYRLYNKGSDLNCPSPANLFVFSDESAYSINDGYLQLGLTSPYYPDVFANYHAGACGFGFVDGHAVIHTWNYSTLLNIPYSPLITGFSVATSASDPDWLWVKSHGGCLQ